jgi:flagellar hook-associated protein 3 FlgL
MRVSTLTAFGHILSGLRSNQLAALRAQEELSSGRRILRASDDPAGTARALALRRELARASRVQEAIGAGRTQLDLAGATLQDSSELLTRARELVLQAMNGTLNERDRATIAAELRELRAELVDDAHLQLDGSFVFGGTATGQEPWVEVAGRAFTKTVYRGNDAEHVIQAGDSLAIGITAVGSRIFAGTQPGPARFDGLTGAGAGTTADEGSGYGVLILRHDATDVAGAVVSGIALVNGGGDDTLLGANVLELDAAAGTVRLGNGPALALPPAGERSDVVVRNEKGGELHLDLTAWNGSSYSGTVTGSGSISFDGDTFTALDFAQADLELANADFGQVLHVDTRSILRAGREFVAFGDTVNAFELLDAVVDDLENRQGLASHEVTARLANRLEALDRVHDQLLVGLGGVGARSGRLVAADARQADLELELRGRLSGVEDADLSEVAVDLARSQLILEVAQAASARVMQTSLLDFLR